MLRDYFVHGLRLRTNLTLPCLPWDPPGAPDVVAERVQGPLEAPGEEPIFDDGSQRTWRSTGGSWFVTSNAQGHTSSLRIRTDPGGTLIHMSAESPKHLLPVLLGPVIACILNHLKHLALQGTALVKDGRAILILGAPGTGKGTTAAALCQQGFQLLADDLAAPRLIPGGAQISAGSFRLKPWPDSARGLSLDTQGLPRLFPKSFHLGAKPAPSPVPDPGPHVLGAIFILQPRDPNHGPGMPMPLEETRALVPLLENLRPGIGGIPVDRASRMLQCAHLAQVCPVYSVQAGTGLERLPLLARTMAEQLQAGAL